MWTRAPASGVEILTDGERRRARGGRRGGGGHRDGRRCPRCTRIRPVGAGGGLVLELGRGRALARVQRRRTAVVVVVVVVVVDEAQVGHCLFHERSCHRSSWRQRSAWLRPRVARRTVPGTRSGARPSRPRPVGVRADGVRAGSEAGRRRGPGPPGPWSSPRPAPPPGRRSSPSTGPARSEPVGQAADQPEARPGSSGGPGRARPPSARPRRGPRPAGRPPGRARPSGGTPPRPGSPATSTWTRTGRPGRRRAMARPSSTRPTRLPPRHQRGQPGHLVPLDGAEEVPLGRRPGVAGHGRRLGHQLVGVVLPDIGEPGRQGGRHRLGSEPLGDGHEAHPSRVGSGRPIRSRRAARRSGEPGERRHRRRGPGSSVTASARRWRVRPTTTHDHTGPGVRGPRGPGGRSTRRRRPCRPRPRRRSGPRRRPGRRRPRRAGRGPAGRRRSRPRTSVAVGGGHRVQVVVAENS